MASNGVCKVILIGNVGQDPESRSFPDGSSVTNISVATSESWKDKDGNQQSRTEWHRVVLRDRGAFKLGQIAAQYLKKGSKVYIEGSLRTRSYDKDGQKFYVTEIIAEQMQMLDPSDSGAPNANQTPQQQQRQQASQNYTQQSPNAALPNAMDFDDDINF